MAIEALKCPNCGANLQIRADQTLVVCAYCNSNVRLSAPVAGLPERVAIAEINWTIIADLPDRRRFVSDGAILLDIRYVRLATLPTKVLSSQAVMPILGSATNHEFGLGDLTPTGHLGHYQAPHDILLNKRYVECLKQVEPAYGPLRFRGRGALDPIILYDGEVVVGAIMPMKP